VRGTSHAETMTLKHSRLTRKWKKQNRGMKDDVKSGPSLNEKEKSLTSIKTKKRAQQQKSSGRETEEEQGSTSKRGYFCLQTQSCRKRKSQRGPSKIDQKKRLGREGTLSKIEREHTRERSLASISGKKKIENATENKNGVPIRGRSRAYHNYP